MSVDEETGMEVIVKPRNTFTSNALKRAVPGTDIKKLKMSLTMSMMTIKSTSGVSLFSENSQGNR